MSFLTLLIGPNCYDHLMKIETSVCVLSKPDQRKPVDMKVENRTSTFTVLSSDALNIEFPSLAKSTHRTLAEWAVNTVDSPLLHLNKITNIVNSLNIFSYTLGIQRRTVLSRDAEAKRWPDGENETQSTASYINVRRNDTWQMILYLLYALQICMPLLVV